MHYLLEVAKSGSMNKAAEQLFISQPTLTKAIKEAEEELGFTIFIRNNRGVTLTKRGDDFVADIRRVYQQYQALMDKYADPDSLSRKRFGVSTQHYSFAAKAFVEMVRQFGTLNYDFAYRETTTARVIEDVATGKSELGILYRSPYNERVIDRHLVAHNLKFTPIVKSQAYVYLWKGHPLARRSGGLPVPVLRAGRGRHLLHGRRDLKRPPLPETGRRPGPRLDAQFDGGLKRLHPVLRHHPRGLQRGGLPLHPL